MNAIQSNKNIELPLREKIANLFSDLMQQIVKGATLDSVLNSVYENFDSVIPFNRIGCALLDESGNRVTARWCRSEREVLLGNLFSAPLKGSSLQFVLEQSRPRILNDLEEYLQKHPNSSSTKLIVDEGFKSSLTFPLIVEGHGVGFLFFSSIKLNAYSEKHLALFGEIAGLVSLGILMTYQRDRADETYSEYISIIDRLVRSVNLRSKHVLQLVSRLGNTLNPRFVEDYETAALLLEAGDVISSEDYPKHRGISSIINHIYGLDIVSSIIKRYVQKGDILLLHHGNIHKESLAIGANLIRTVRKYKELEESHSSIRVPIEHLRRHPEIYAPFIVDELEQIFDESVRETVLKATVDELVDGMVLKEHVTTSDGTILISSHHIVNEEMRHCLKSYGGNGIQVMEPIMVIPPQTDRDM